MVHHYYDHRTQQYRQQTLTQEDMLGRYINHIPAKHLKMVRYYGFLSNRKRGEPLPKVYKVLQMEARKKTEQPGFAALMKAFLHTELYKCILCGNRLRFSSVLAGRDTPRSWWQKGCTTSTGNDGFWHRPQDKCA